MAMNEISTGKFSLVDLWQERVSPLHPGEFQKPLTGKDRGQLKMLANQVGAETREVIIYALENWNEFGQKARSCACAPDYPARPRIGFLLTYCDVAVNLMRQSAAAKRKKTEAKAKAKRELDALKPKPVPVSAQRKHPPMTPEEKAAAYREFVEWSEAMEKKNVRVAAPGIIDS